jgi:hypothetical protein
MHFADVDYFLQQISKEITQNQELKASNAALNKKLEFDVTRQDALEAAKMNLEGQMETMQVINQPYWATALANIFFYFINNNINRKKL